MARTKKTARRTCVSYLPCIESHMLTEGNMQAVYRINNRLAIVKTSKYLLLIDVTQKINLKKPLKIIKDLQKLDNDGKGSLITVYDNNLRGVKVL